jgi:hypothetical protein
MPGVSEPEAGGSGSLNAAGKSIWVTEPGGKSSISPILTIVVDSRPAQALVDTTMKIRTITMSAFISPRRRELIVM